MPAPLTPDELAKWKAIGGKTPNSSAGSIQAIRDTQYGNQAGSGASAGGGSYAASPNGQAEQAERDKAAQQLIDAYHPSAQTGSSIQGGPSESSPSTTDTSAQAPPANIGGAAGASAGAGVAGSAAPVSPSLQGLQTAAGMPAAGAPSWAQSQSNAGPEQQHISSYESPAMTGLREALKAYRLY